MRLLTLFYSRICNKAIKFQWRNLSFIVPQQFPSWDTPSLLDQTMASLHNISSNPCFHLLGLCRNIVSLKRIHGFLLVHDLTNDILCSTKLVSLYGQFGYISVARKVFDEMPDPDFYSCKVMLRWYFLNDMFHDIIGFYACMRSCTSEVDNVVFSVVLKACSELREIREGRKVHCRIIKAGSPDSFVLTGLVDMYAKCGEIECSRDVFDRSDHRNVVSWTSMIVGYVQNGCPREGLMLFNSMREVLVDANQVTLGSLVAACTKLRALHQGKWVHGYLIKRGYELNSHLVACLLNMYVKCGILRDARSVFDEFSGTDLVTWTAMISGYAQSGCAYEALKLFLDKRWVGIMPNSVTLTSVLSACSELRILDLGRSLHGLALKLGTEETSVLNSLVYMYARCCMNRDAWDMFETVSDKDAVAWNSIISGYAQNGSAHEAIELFHRMRMGSVLPDAVSLVSVFSAYATLCALRVGSSLHAYSIKGGLISSSVHLGTTILTFYAKCGDARSARAIFDAMDEKNAVTWSAIIGCYGNQGDGTGSLELFNSMLKEELKPNDVIFTTVLSACSHTGMVGEGWKLFASMCQDHNIVPSMKHYSCMVDLLARAGRLEEALDFIDKMPIRPGVSVFGAFLHGCGLHSRFDLGEVAIRRLQELHPQEACYYVLMCNLYASDGRWSQVKQVRELMKQKAMMKSPGCSVMAMDFEDDVSSCRVVAGV